jgi:enoyl-CoA hydratase/carnithine racemase
MYEQLREICQSLVEDDATKVLILCGAGGRAFAAGTDISQFRNFKTTEDAIGYEQFMDSVLGALERCPIPTVAALSGACTGGGAAIAAACDLRICTSDLKFGFPIARTLGNCLSCDNISRLATLVGAGRTRELIFTSRLMDANEALTLSLVSEVLPDYETLMARAQALAGELMQQAPLTLRATKEALRRLRVNNDVEDDDLILMCYMSADFREGLDAFLNKRKPRWKGR